MSLRKGLASDWSSIRRPLSPSTLTVAMATSPAAESPPDAAAGAFAAAALALPLFLAGAAGLRAASCLLARRPPSLSTTSSAKRSVNTSDWARSPWFAAQTGAASRARPSRRAPRSPAPAGSRRSPSSPTEAALTRPFGAYWARSTVSPASVPISPLSCCGTIRVLRTLTEPAAKDCQSPLVTVPTTTSGTCTVSGRSPSTRRARPLVWSLWTASRWPVTASMPEVANCSRRSRGSLLPAPWARTSPWPSRAPFRLTVGALTSV